MSQQDDHVVYTRKEWTTVPLFVQMIEYLKDKNVQFFVDIGANVGEVSKILLEKLPTLKKVCAYEPEASNYLYLKNRFLDEPRMIPVNKAIFYGSNSTLFVNGWCGSHTLTKNTGYPLQNVDVAQLESEELDGADLIKMDIEGSEYSVIENSTFLKGVRFIIIEFHPFSFPDPSFDAALPPPVSEKRQERADYIKMFTDKFVQKHFPNHKVVIGVEEQYLLELI